MLRDEWVARILSLKGDQAYAVSSFEPTPLYGGRPTYIYGAAIQDPRRLSVVGGIAIVFDSAPQFAAMLTDALPRDGAGAVKDGAFGLLAGPDGRIIACSDDKFRPGDTVSVDPAFLRLPPGQATRASPYWATAITPSARRPPRAIANTRARATTIATRSRAGFYADLRCCRPRQQSRRSKSLSIRSDRAQAGDKESVATFTVGDQMFAVRARDIVEAVDDAAIVTIPSDAARHEGLLYL